MSKEERVVPKKNLIGQMLIKKGIITHEQLEKALAVQKNSGGLLGDVLIQLGFLSQETLSMELASQTEMVYIPIEKYKVAPELFKLIPRDVALKYYCIPLEEMDGVLAVVMANPLDDGAVGEIERATKHKIVSMIGTKIQIEKTLRENYPT